MPGAPFTVAGTRERVSAAGMTPTAATRTFARRAEEVPIARQFIRDILVGHPASFDVELLTCELVTNAVQHATGAADVTVAASLLKKILPAKICAAAAPRSSRASTWPSVRISKSASRTAITPAAITKPTFPRTAVLFTSPPHPVPANT